MKTKYSLLFVLMLSVMKVLAQQDVLEKEFQPVKDQFVAWDSVRGEWLATSLFQLAVHQPIPSRTFPEAYTPFEMLAAMNSTQRDQTGRTVQTQRQNSQNTLFWKFIEGVFNRVNCQPTTARSYGDPHFKSFDGNNFSLQSVGEFILIKSSDGFVNIQSRQKARGADVSLNTGVAMNVGGDRVALYSDEKPDSDISTPLRVEGRPIKLSGNTYFLPHGGTITTKGNDYIITWPTGEKLVASTNNFRFGNMNLMAQIYPCEDQYEGIFGNANGTPKDDIQIRNGGVRNDLYSATNKFGGVVLTNESSNEAERIYLAQLAKDFGNSWRVTNETTLFDYGVGETTLTYTDLNFPQIHRTVGDLSQNQQNKARRKCEEQGVRGEDLKGCIFDMAYIGMDPTPPPVIERVQHDQVLPRVPVQKPVVTPVDHGNVIHKNSDQVNQVPVEKTQVPDRQNQSISNNNETLPQSKSTTSKQVEPIEQKSVEDGTISQPKSTNKSTNAGEVKPVVKEQSHSNTGSSAPTHNSGTVIQVLKNGTQQNEKVPTGSNHSEGTTIPSGGGKVNRGTSEPVQQMPATKRN